MEKKHSRYPDIRVFDLAKMAVCFEKKFLFDPKGNFKNVEIEAKNGDLGLENGHGSKRSLTLRKKTESCSAFSSRNFSYRCIVLVWIREIKSYV